jgi:hypothetical protein
MSMDSPWTTTLPSGAKLWARQHSELFLNRLDADLHFQLLNLGTVDLDAANVLAGANQFPVGLPPQLYDRRDLIMIAALIYYPNVGLILFDTGSCEDIIQSWGA